jgi:hypothetical protein
MSDFIDPAVPTGGTAVTLRWCSPPCRRLVRRREWTSARDNLLDPGDDRLDPAERPQLRMSEEP